MPGTVRDGPAGPLISDQHAQFDEPFYVPSGRPSGVPRHLAVSCCRNVHCPATDEQSDHANLTLVETVGGDEFLQYAEATED